MVKERAKTQKDALNEISLTVLGSLLVLSFLLTGVTSLIIFGFRGGFSIGTAVVYVVFVVIFGALIVMIKEKAYIKNQTFDASSLILVTALLVLSLLGAWSIGKLLSFFNSILTLFLLTRTQHYKFAFCIVLVLSALLAYMI
jgi:uncharacterized membrane protein